MPSRETKADIDKENVRVLMRLRGPLSLPLPISSSGYTWLCSGLPGRPLFYVFTHMDVVWEDFCLVGFCLFWGVVVYKSPK